MDDRFTQSLLFDFYGELLTDRQKEIFEKYISEDLSLSELSEEYGISRQGIHDLITRSNKTLLDYEAKLGIMERFLKIREDAGLIRKAALRAKSSLSASCEKDYELDKIKILADKIIEEA
ncbi:MAG: DNA-binding protein [Lachnospiraceae bacterium]|jgi:predicted DNA-binding protein YlxM (UPF0122 family)|nr:DNA-binding protein [Lachnospiraceae bacterium]